MATPNLTTDLGFGPSFTVAADWEHPSSYSVRYEGGAGQAWQTSTKRLRRWQLTYENLTTTQRNSLMAYVDARGGSYGLHYFNHVGLGENDIPVRFQKGSVKEQWVAPGVWTVQIVIEEFTS